MIRGPKYTRATDLPDELKLVGAINAYEINPDLVRVACQLSDEDETISVWDCVEEWQVIHLTAGELIHGSWQREVYLGTDGTGRLEEILCPDGDCGADSMRWEQKSGSGRYEGAPPPNDTWQSTLSRRLGDWRC